MSNVEWRKVNSEPFEYAIQRGANGDEFVKLLDGSCLRRPTQADEIERLRSILDIALDEHDNNEGVFALDYMPNHWTHQARAALHPNEQSPRTGG